MECGDGRVCPEGKVCASVTNPDEQLCVLQGQVDACAGQESLAACLTDGRCYDGVCLTAGCGNVRKDPDEDCDDGNALIGDGCTPTCHSEVCGNGIIDPLDGELCDDGDLIGHDGCNSTCLPERLTWEEVSPTTVPPVPLRPRARWRHAMAYDVVRGRVVMFGGMRGNSMSQNDFVNDGETWEWGGRGWVQRFPSFSPRVRNGHAMAYDAARQRVVLFGGALSNPADIGAGPLHFNDTWEWDGNEWIQILSTGARPDPRSNHAMTYDPVRKRVVLVGGTFYDGNLPSPFLDTWTWDGTKWETVPTTGTVFGGAFTSIVYDPAKNRIVACGGDGTANGVTYALTGTTWSSVAPSGCFPRTSLAYDVASQKIIAFGGSTGLDDLTTIRRFDDGAPGGWTNVGSFTGRQELATASDLDRRVIVAFGGIQYGSTGISETLEWRNNGFMAPVLTPSPSPRGFTAVATDFLRGVVVLFGGFAAGTTTNDTYELDGQGWGARTPTVSPTPTRAAHALVYDMARKVVVLFGGTSTTPGLYFDDTWAYNGVTWEPRSSAVKPSPRAYHAMAYDAARARVVLFGGIDATGVIGDTWEWDGTAWTRIATTGAPARSVAAMTYDPIRKRVVLAAGIASDGILLADTWTWDGTAWTDVTPATAAPIKSYAGFAWDPARRRSVLFGGVPQDETIWSWDGAVWTADVATAGPSARAQNVVASDPMGAGVITFGGTDNVIAHNDTWRLRSGNDQVTYESCRQRVDLDGDTKFGCDDLDCWESCTPLCLPGTICDPTLPRCGDGVCNPALETHRMCPMDMCSTVPACGDLLCEGSETAVACPGDCP